VILYTGFSHPHRAHKVLICGVVVGLSDLILYYGLFSRAHKVLSVRWSLALVILYTTGFLTPVLTRC
jgi:hypothetical protein